MDEDESVLAISTAQLTPRGPLSDRSVPALGSATDCRIVLSPEGVTLRSSSKVVDRRA